MKISQIGHFIFDFDGVLTDNRVFVGEGLDSEFVVCNRADGLAFDAIRKLDINCFIVSTDKSLTSKTRAKKLGIKAYNNIQNKGDLLEKLSKNKELDLQRSFYVGNDINDLESINLCKFSACPSDSQSEVKKSCSFTLKTKGGEGVVREILEDIFKLNLAQILYEEKN